MARKRDNTRERERAQARKARDAEVKKKAAELKKRGLIYENKDLRKTKVTAYMRKRVRQLEGVLTGDLVALTPPRKPSEYKDEKGVVATTKKKLIVQNEPNTVQGFRKGRRARVIPLGDGNTIEMLSMPRGARNVEQVRKLIESGELDKMKAPKEYFAFRFNGFPSLQTFPNASALAQYLEQYEADEGEEPDELVIYRVYPPGEWNDLVKRERAEYAAARDFNRRVERERRKPNRKPRFTPAEIAEAKEAREMMRKEKDRLRKRAKRLSTTDEQRARNAARMREKRGRK